MALRLQLRKKWRCLNSPVPRTRETPNEDWSTTCARLILGVDKQAALGEGGICMSQRSREIDGPFPPQVAAHVDKLSDQHYLQLHCLMWPWWDHYSESDHVSSQ